MHHQAPGLLGLVVAGGRSSRMGADKGALAYRGQQPHAAFLHALLAGCCDPVFVSINASQAHEPPYDELPVIIDTLPPQGPATGLLSGWCRYSDAAWLVAAVDLALLDAQTLNVLVSGRRPSAVATAFLHDDGTLEPLCTIWEPAAQPILAERVQRGDASLRRLLDTVDVERLTCPDPRALTSCNTAAERRLLLGEAPPD